MFKCTSYAVANQKGGVGKTTTTENVALGLARNGNELLIVDFAFRVILLHALDGRTMMH